MFPRKPLEFRQVFAQRAGGAETGFAPKQTFGQDADIGGCGPKGLASDCYPFPSTWPGPLWVGPIFSVERGLASAGFRQRRADRAGYGEFHFSSGGKAVESDAITTTIRGNLSCGKLSPFFSSCRSACRPACKTPRRAALPVQRLAQPSLTRPKAISSMVPSLAVLRALPLAAFRPACRPATDLTAAFAASTTIRKGQSGQSPAGPLPFAPAPRASEGREPCSRRS